MGMGTGVCGGGQVLFLHTGGGNTGEHPLSRPLPPNPMQTKVKRSFPLDCWMKRGACVCVYVCYLTYRVMVERLLATMF